MKLPKIKESKPVTEQDKEIVRFAQKHNKTQTWILKNFNISRHRLNRIKDTVEYEDTLGS